METNRTGIPLLGPYINAWKRIFDYKGKTSRIDFWEFRLVNWMLITGFLGLLFALGLIKLDNQPLNEGIDPYRLIAISVSFIWVVASLIALIPLHVRRLRDSGKSLLWLMLAPINLVPVVGIFTSIWMTWILCQPSTKNEAKNEVGSYGLFTVFSLIGLLVNWIFLLSPSLSVHNAFNSSIPLQSLLSLFFIGLIGLWGLIASYKLLNRRKSALSMARVQLIIISTPGLLALPSRMTSFMAGTITNPQLIIDLLLTTLPLIALAFWFSKNAKKYLIS